MTCGILKSRVFQIFLHMFLVIHRVCSWYISIHLGLLGKQLKYSQVWDSAFAFLFWIQVICGRQERGSSRLDVWLPGTEPSLLRWSAQLATASAVTEVVGWVFPPYYLISRCLCSLSSLEMCFHVNLKAKLDCFAIPIVVLCPVRILPSPGSENSLWVLHEDEDAHEGDDRLLDGNEHRAMEITIPEAGEGPWVLNVTLPGRPGNPSCGLLRVVPWILSVIPGIFNESTSVGGATL